jgi:hypothetical protein
VDNSRHVRRAEQTAAASGHGINRQWHADACPARCSYAAEGLEHFHERHDDGSSAVVAWSEGGSFSLLEFQGTLGF